MAISEIVAYLASVADTENVPVPYDTNNHDSSLYILVVSFSISTDVKYSWSWPIVRIRGGASSWILAYRDFKASTFPLIYFQA